LGACVHSEEHEVVVGTTDCFSQLVYMMEFSVPIILRFKRFTLPSFGAARAGMIVAKIRRRRWAMRKRVFLEIRLNRIAWANRKLESQDY
jgi:hypothetical protein